MNSYRRSTFALVAATLAGVLTVGLAPPASAAPTSVPSSTRGWYASNGDHEAANENYCAGLWCWEADGVNTRNFFTYDLADYADEALDYGVIDAWLTLPAPVDTNGLLPYQLHPAKTPIANLDLDHAIDDAAGMAIYKDLGDGTLLGTVTPGPTDDPVVVPLNAEGRLAVTKQLGTAIAFGGVQVHSVVDGNMIFGGTSSAQTPASTALDFYLGPATSLTIAAPSKVQKGAHPLVQGQVSSDEPACEADVDLKVTAGGTKTTVNTTATGHYSFHVTINKRTNIRVFDQGDQTCAGSDAQATIRLS